MELAIFRQTQSDVMTNLYAVATVVFASQHQARRSVLDVDAVIAVQIGLRLGRAEYVDFGVVVISSFNLHRTKNVRHFDAGVGG